MENVTAVSLAAMRRVVFIVPFDPRLYSRFDKEIGHFRHYQKAELEQKMQAAGLRVERQFYFNKAGVIAWWVSIILLGQRCITSWQLRVGFSKLL